MKILEKFIKKHLSKSRQKIRVYNYGKLRTAKNRKLREKKRTHPSFLLKEFIRKHITKSKRKIRQFKYRQDNKEKIKKVDKINYRKNKEKKKIQNKVWRENNKEKRKKLYDDWFLKNTEKKLKYNRISNWKRFGVKSDNYEYLYEKWKNTKNCENCNVKLTDDKYLNTRRVLDHSHTTGEFRNILCHLCNIRRGETNI